MSLAGLLNLSKQISGLDQLAASGLSVDLSINAIKAMQPFIVATAARKSKTLIAVTATSRESEDLAATLSALDPDLAVRVFPSWETLPHEKLSPSSEVVGKRLALIHELKSGVELNVICAPLRSLLQPFAADLGSNAPLRLKV